MSTGLDAQPTATTIDVETLTKWAWGGRIRIPHFQRPLRWQRDDVIKLFDSIKRGYPIGSLLLWSRPAPAETLKLIAPHRDVPAIDNALYVVDGQQRVISLANTLHPDGEEEERFRLSYDLRKGVFVPTSKDEEATVIPLPVIFNLRSVLQWFTDHPEAADYVAEANQITQAIRQFKIPAYEVSNESPEALRDIFDRMNNYGKSLTRAEIFSAINAGDENARNVTPTLDWIAQKINDELGFGLIDNDTLLQAVLARRGPDVHRNVRSEFGESVPVGSAGNHERSRAIIDFPDEDRDSAYTLGEEAIRDAVRFLQDEAGVPHVTFLPYKYLLVVLTRVFAHHRDMDDRNRQLVRRWFWRAAIVGPEIFRGSTSGAVRQLNRAITPGDLDGSVKGLLDLIPPTSAKPPNLKRFRSNEASTKVVLCSWWSGEPRSLTTGDPFERSDLADAIGEARAPLDAIQYVVSRYQVREDRRQWAANRALYPAGDRSGTGPLEGVITRQSRVPGLDTAAWEQALASHLISPELADCVRRGDVEAFVAARQDALEGQLATFLARQCEWGYEDTPSLGSLVIDDDDEAEELGDDDA